MRRVVKSQSMIEAHRKKLVTHEQRGNRFAEKLTEHSMLLRRARPEILQVNVGKLCNLTCVHCHVNAGPKRKEIMTRETIDRIVDWFGRTDIPTIDLTGGAPEMIPDFCYFIEQVKSLEPRRHIIDRCNLTILVERDYTDLAPFLARNKVEIINCSTPWATQSIRTCRCILFTIRWARSCRRRKPSSRPITSASSKDISGSCLTSSTR